MNKQLYLSLALGLLTTSFFVFAQQNQPTPAQAEVIAKAAKEGEPIYAKFCAGCHGDKGQGGVGSKLDGLAALKDKPGMISQMLGGGQQMPAFGAAVNDKEGAALLTFIFNSWSNKFGLVTEAEVKARR